MKISTLTFLAPNYLRKVSICNKQNKQNSGEMQEKKLMSKWPSSWYKNIFVKISTKHICNPGEKVFVRIGKKRGKFAKRHKVLAETVEKRYQDDTYLVKYKSLNSDHSTKNKFRIEDISDFPKDKKCERKGKRKEAYQKSLCIIKTRNDLMDEITVCSNYVVTYDPPGDGNCQFSALCDSLLSFGIF